MPVSVLLSRPYLLLIDRYSEGIAMMNRLLSCPSLTISLPSFSTIEEKSLEKRESDSDVKMFIYIDISLVSLLPTIT